MRFFMADEFDLHKGTHRGQIISKHMITAFIINLTQT